MRTLGSESIFCVGGKKYRLQSWCEVETGSINNELAIAEEDGTILTAISTHMGNLVDDCTTVVNRTLPMIYKHPTIEGLITKPIDVTDKAYRKWMVVTSIQIYTKFMMYCFKTLRYSFHINYGLTREDYDRWLAPAMRVTGGVHLVRKSPALKRIERMFCSEVGEYMASFTKHTSSMTEQERNWIVKDISTYPIAIARIIASRINGYARNLSKEVFTFKRYIEMVKSISPLAKKCPHQISQGMDMFICIYEEISKQKMPADRMPHCMTGWYMLFILLKRSMREGATPVYDEDNNITSWEYKRISEKISGILDFCTKMDNTVVRKFARSRNERPTYGIRVIHHILDTFSDAWRIRTEWEQQLERLEKRKYSGKMKKAVDKVKELARQNLEHTKEFEMGIWNLGDPMLITTSLIDKALHIHNLDRPFQRAMLECEENLEFHIPRQFKIPKSLEKYRMKTRKEMLLAGQELHHCIGSYATEERHEQLVHFRKDTVCLQWNLWSKETKQCYDDHDNITDASRRFKTYVEREFRKLHEKDKKSSPAEVRYSYTLADNEAIPF